MISTKDMPPINPKPAIERDPQYIILFSSGAFSIENYKPILGSDDLNLLLKHTLSNSYGFDPDLVPAIPALLYCLCLPRNRFDFQSTPLFALKTSQNLDISQHIILIPTPYPNNIQRYIDSAAPTILFYPDNILDAANTLSKGIKTLIDMPSISSLNPKLLSDHWLRLHSLFEKKVNKFADNIPMISENHIRPYILPTFFLMRQFANTKTLKKLSNIQSKEEAFRYYFQTQSVLSAASVFKNEGVANPTQDQFNDVISEEQKNFTCPVVVCLPGASPRSSIRLLDKLNNTKITEPVADDAGKSILAFLATHRAIARSGHAIFARDLEAEAFNALSQLEQMWRDASLLKPAKIGQIMDVISKHVKIALEEEDEISILHGSSLTAFSEFPIGLATLGNDTSPLACRMPIAYRPLTPLTRTLQFELSRPSLRYLGDRLRVVVLECIPQSDRVGKLSRLGWQFMKDAVSRDKQISWVYIEISSLNDLKKALEENKTDIVVISAHGHYDLKGNYSGFICGNDLVLEQELGDLPPVVILSSCQIWPRGSGTISVADILVRQGAVAIIGTLIPIDVRKNALLMTRFFINVAATLRGEMPLRTIQDVWHFVTTSNAVNDILDGNKKLKDWAHEGNMETSVVFEFEQNKSIGRLRKAHIYKDSEQVLLEIAHERGVEKTFESWMKFPGYVPESVFYPVIGWPERIVLSDPLMKRMNEDLKNNSSSMLRGLSMDFDSLGSMKDVPK